MCIVQVTQNIYCSGHTREELCIIQVREASEKSIALSQVLH